MLPQVAANLKTQDCTSGAVLITMVAAQGSTCSCANLHSAHMIRVAPAQFRNMPYTAIQLPALRLFSTGYNVYSNFSLGS